MIYLATNYSDEKSKVRRERFERVTRYAALLAKSGKLVFSPITHGHPIAQCGGLPTSFEYWKDHALAMLALCDLMIVYQQPGWEFSIGLDAETQAADSMGIPIEMVMA